MATNLKIQMFMFINTTLVLVMLYDIILTMKNYTALIQFIMAPLFSDTKSGLKYSPLVPPKGLMIGSSLLNKGGMISVVQMYQQAGLLENIPYLSSHIDGGLEKRLIIFIRFLFIYILALTVCPSIGFVHMHMSECGSFYRKSLTLIIAKLYSKKVILHMHGAEFVSFYQNAPLFIQAYIRWVMRTADCLIALSSNWKQDLLKISPDAKIEVIFNPCIMKAERQVVKKDKVQFLFLGRLGERKGVYDILKAAEQLREANVDISLYGDGEVEAARNIVKKNQLHDVVKVHGWISGEEKDAVFENADVLLLPSYHEGLPIAILEALSQGMPVISTPVGGIPEAVHDGVNGFIVQAGDHVALGNRIQVLAKSQELRSKMGHASQAIAHQKFEITTILQEIECLYNKLTGSFALRNDLNRMTKAVGHLSSKGNAYFNQNESKFSSIDQHQNTKINKSESRR